jgi:hypothetical protein
MIKEAVEKPNFSKAFLVSPGTNAPTALPAGPRPRATDGPKRAGAIAPLQAGGLLLLRSVWAMIEGAW